MGYVLKSENNFEELSLSFRGVGPRNLTQVVTIGGTFIARPSYYPMILNFWSSCLYLVSQRVPPYPLYFVLKIRPRASYAINRHFSNGVVFP